MCCVYMSLQECVIDRYGVACGDDGDKVGQSFFNLWPEHGMRTAVIWESMAPMAKSRPM